MDYQRVSIHIFALLLWFLATSCLEDVDFSGFVTNDTPVNERFEQSQQWNRQNPQRTRGTSEDSYQLFVAADVHIGGTRNFNQFIHAGVQSNVQAFILAGDVVTGHKHDYDTLKNHLQKIPSIPVFMVTGNHDLYFKGWDYFYSYFGSSTYTVTMETPGGNDLLIFLDTGSGTVGRDQLAWLQKTLTTRNNYRHCIVVTHNNFFRARHTTSTNLQLDELHLLLDWFYDFKVDMVIMGHDHRHSIEQFGPTTYITMDALLDGFKHASYLSLQVTADGISYTFNQL